MIHRPLGKTGLQVSHLGFGAMRLPMRGDGAQARVDRDRATPMIHRAFEAGVNYIDTAVMYCNDDGQAAVGDALKGWRDKVILSTKNHYFGTDEKAWWQNLEDSLERLQVDYIDLYNHHGIQWKTYEEHIAPRMHAWMEKAKDQGLIRHIGVSFHDTNEALENVVRTGYPEVITLQYNLLDRQLEKGMALAREHGIAVVVMGPAGGGRLGASSEILASVSPTVKRVPELALRFVLANPNVTIAISGMSTMDQVVENIALANDETALAADDKAAIDRHLTRLQEAADLYCTGCGYCKPCPSGVDIPRVFQIYNEARVYGLWDQARETYAGMCQNDKEGQRAATACEECGDCEPKCPQNIPVPEQLKEAHAALTDQGG